MSLPGRRLLAFGLDYLLILFYMGVLALVSLTFVAPHLRFTQPWQTQLLGFAILTLPVYLYFALNESLCGGTFGKRWLGLSVTEVSGAPLSLRRSLLRSACKFAPWELAHVAVHRLVFWTADERALSFGEWILVLGFNTLSLGLVTAYIVGLFRSQPHYDLIGRSRVRRTAPQGSFA